VFSGYGKTAGTAKAVKPYLSLPTAPKSVKATAASSSLVVTWKAPANDGGENITDYRVEWSTNGLTWTPASAGTGLTYTITGLTPGVGYKVRVSATNTVFSGYGPLAAIAKPAKPRV
jgi:titin